MVAMRIPQVLALVCLLAASVVRAQEESLHIGCGLKEAKVDGLGTTWEPDAAYISTGSVGTPGEDYLTYYKTWPEMQHNRHFPDVRGKSCFTLPVKPGTTYMLRAMFMYGDYDGAVAGSKYPSFGVALDSSVVENVTITISAYYGHIRELTFRATRNETSFCLLRDASQSVPFVNSLALRPVPALHKLIAEKVGLNQSVSTMTRINFHRTGGEYTWFDAGGGNKSDMYDRYWRSTNGSQLNNYPMNTAGFVTSTAPLEFPVTTSMVTKLVSDPVENSVPQHVLSGAVTSSGPITIPLNSSIAFKALILYYFVELDIRVNITDRQFVLQSPGAKPYPISVASLTDGPLRLSVMFHENAVISADSEIVMSPNPASTSPRGPIISALEVFKVDIPALLPTNDRDYDAIRSINSDMLSRAWLGDPCLPVPHDWLICNPLPSTHELAVVTAVLLSNYSLSGSISPAFNQLLLITTLDLSNNALTGPIPDLRALKNLKTLRLQNNRLTGPLPAWLAELPLQELLVQNNDLNGSFPGEFLTKNWKFDYSGNARLTVGAPSSQSSKTSLGLIIGAVVGGLVVIAIIIALIVFCVCRKRRRKTNDIPHPPPAKASHPMPGAGARVYSLAELDAATGHYQTVIGRGGFGPVYYGRMPDGKEVAVKTLDTASKQGETEFFNEVDILSRVHHRHLVTLYGYCRAGGKQMLVYEYIHKGSLRDHLDGDTSKVGDVVLDWKTRLNIGLQAALGLEYMHMGCNPGLIHRDVKSTNILITSNNEAKVADFGLSKLVGEDNSAEPVMTMVKGTTGYLDPEYYQSNFLSHYSDVYSFGVVLLELITGRMPISRSMVPNEVNPTLVDSVRSSLMGGDIDTILDPQLRASHPNHASLWKVAEIALRSVEPKSAHRPTMNEIVQELQGAAALEKLDSDPSSNSNHHPAPPPAPPRFHHSRIPPGHSDFPSDSNVQFGLDSSSYPAPR